MLLHILHDKEREKYLWKYIKYVIGLQKLGLSQGKAFSLLYL